MAKKDKQNDAFGRLMGAGASSGRRSRPLQQGEAKAERGPSGPSGPMARGPSGPSGPSGPMSPGGQGRRRRGVKGADDLMRRLYGS